MTDSSPLAISLFSELLTADQLLRNRLTRVLPNKMEISHFSVLNQLARGGSEKTPAQLAKAFHVTRGAMTNTLGKLEAAGYVHIRPDWDDARRKQVSISPAGLSARDAAIAAITPLINEMVEELGEKGPEHFNRNKGEAFRQFVNLMIGKLPVDMMRGHATQLADIQGAYVHSAQLIDDLKLLQTALIQFGAKSTAYDNVVNAISIVQTFGFHLAALDIRQNSDFHDKAIEQLLEAAQAKETNFSEWDEEKRLAFLTWLI